MEIRREPDTTAVPVSLTLGSVVLGDRCVVDRPPEQARQMERQAEFGSQVGGDLGQAATDPERLARLSVSGEARAEGPLSDSGTRPAR